MKKPLYLIVALLLSIPVIGQNASADSSNQHYWSFSGEFFGSALSVGLFGEHIWEVGDYNLTVRAGIGKTNIFQLVDPPFIDNLTFPHLISVSHQGPGAKVAFELSAGGAIDFFEDELMRIVDNEVSTHKEVSTYYRIIPLAIGIKTMNQENLFWRYHLALNVVPKRTIFPSIGVSFGKILR